MKIEETQLKDLHSTKSTPGPLRLDLTTPAPRPITEETSSRFAPAKNTEREMEFNLERL